MAGPLTGLRVLDLSRILAGPWCTQMLADWGADVLKIEQPGAGDDTRHWGPPFLGGSKDGFSAYFLACNRGKRSLALDLKDPEDLHRVRDLAADADVLIENFKPGTLARLGLSVESLHALNPALLICSISGFGQSGPNTQRAGYDAMIQAEAGLMSITGVPDGEPGAGPVKVGVAVSDLMCGMYAASAILAALHGRAQSGRGDHIDIALFDTQVAWLANQASNQLNGGDPPTRLGSAHPNIVPYQAFASADGHFMLACGNDAQFERLCALLGRSNWLADGRWRSNAGRVTHRAAVVAALSGLFVDRSREYWLDALAAAGIPAGPINTLSQVFASAQVTERALVSECRLANGARARVAANPVRFAFHSPDPVDPPPALDANRGQGWLPRKPDD